MSEEEKYWTHAHTYIHIYNIKEINKLWIMDDFKNYKIMVHQGQADGQMHKSKQASTHTKYEAKLI